MIFFSFWTSKWPVSVHCGTPVGEMHPPIPLYPPLAAVMHAIKVVVGNIAQW